MSDLIPDLRDVPPELVELAEKYCLQTLDEAEMGRLNALLCDDARAQSFFLAYGNIHAQLAWEYGPQPATEPAKDLEAAAGGRLPNLRGAVDINRSAITDDQTVGDGVIANREVIDARAHVGPNGTGPRHEHRVGAADARD